MKVLYLECNMGAAGDMLMAALLELHPQPRRFLEQMNGLGLPGVHICAQPSVRCGITGTHVRVTVHGEEEHDHHHDHHHSHLHDIHHIISHLDLPEQVKQNARVVYDRLAQAESRAHATTVDQIHFHEVGTLDAVADVVGVCLLMQELGAEKIVASPVHVGCGQVHCAHGILPVPAPATAWLLRDVPTYGGGIQAELCTPTGAALLRHFAAEFGPQPVMRVEKIGYGMGTKEFGVANCVRAMLGEAEEKGRDTVVELRCNLDDMTGEAIGFAVEELLQAGALDVFTTPIQMKKNRPGTLLTVLCREAEREAFVRLLFQHTTTLGVRETLCSRYVLDREEHTEDTRYGPVRFKTACGYGVTRQKPEYEDLVRIAREQGRSIMDVKL